MMMAVTDFYDLFTKRQPPRSPHAAPIAIRDGEGTQYARAALRREAAAVSSAPEGVRNDQLNRSAFNLSQLVNAGHLPAQDVWDALTVAARSAGLPEAEIEGTLRSGYRGAEHKPRTSVPDPNEQDDSWLPDASTLPTSPTSSDTTSPPGSSAPSADTGGPSTPAPGTPPAVDAEPSGIPELTTLVQSHLPIIDWHALWADDEEEEWILEPLLPARRLVALYSPPKVGKSLLMLELAVAVARGTEALGTTPDRARRVLYVDFENDPKSDVRSRLQAMGHGPGDLDNLCYLSFPTLAGLDSERGSAELLAAVQVYECEVVVIDTVSRSVDGEENENDTWLNFYRHTGLKLKQQQVALIRLDHTGKDETKGQRGGSAKVGDVDAVWKLSKVADEVFRLDCEANRMPVTEKVLVLDRHQIPLRHTVQPGGRMAAWEAKVAHATAVLEAADIGPEATTREIDAAARAGGSARAAAREAHRVRSLGTVTTLDHDRWDQQ